MNRAAHEAGDMVKLIELEGEEKLFYPAFPIDIAVIRATYADERGNCTFEREGVYAEALAQAQAAHNSGGRVIVQVRLWWPGRRTTCRPSAPSMTPPFPERSAPL